MLPKPFPEEQGHVGLTTELDPTGQGTHCGAPLTHEERMMGSSWGPS